MTIEKDQHCSVKMKMSISMFYAFTEHSRLFTRNPSVYYVGG